VDPDRVLAGLIFCFNFSKRVKALLNVGLSIPLIAAFAEILSNNAVIRGPIFLSTEGLAWEPHKKTMFF
jgi:hypothetical protein